MQQDAPRPALKAPSLGHIVGSVVLDAIVAQVASSATSWREAPSGHLVAESLVRDVTIAQIAAQPPRGRPSIP